MMICNLRASPFLLLCLLSSAYSFGIKSSSANSGSVLCVESERQALIRFKQDLIVPSNRLLSWTTSQPDCCKWDEIVCDNFTGHVKELHLHNPYGELNYKNTSEYLFSESSKLQGKINPSLLDLKYIDYLDLSHNDFRGISIPNFFGSLVSLTYLNLSEAGFQGLVPHQLGNLSSLQHLSISDHFYSLYVENLHWLKNLSSLVHLDLQTVNLTSASHDWLEIINSFPSLLELNLFYCELVFIPPLSIVNFTSLSFLDISSNSFSGTSIPEWTLSLSKLKFLDLSNNGFAGPLPNGLSNLSSLTFLSLANNQLTSPLPKWLFGLDSLVTLSLSYNNFRGPFPTCFQNLSSLVKLDLSYNELEGNFPPTMRSLCNLQEINLCCNKLGGEISNVLESISGCSSLNQEANFMSNNNFSGSIPESFQRPSSLAIVDLSQNQLIGNIPQSLGTLSNLKELYINYNKLEGIVSEIHFKNLTNLVCLDASFNNLTLKVSSNWVPPFRLHTLHLSYWNIGPQFPSWLEYQANLSELDLSCTGISNPIPSWFWNLSSQLSYLNLSHNEINGELPNSLGTEFQYQSGLYVHLLSNNLNGPLPQISENIVLLDLSKNSFSGSLSVLLCNPMAQVNSLEFLNLGENNLSGEIPDCWMYWPSLEVIVLGNNNLTGKIPRSVTYLTLLQSLHLRNNNLFGEIPASLQNCTKLKILDLGFNNFAGKIPEWLGSFQYLIILALPSNNLVGKIPSKFCHLTSLQILDLAGNNLSRRIPTCINNLTAMSIEKEFDSEGIYSNGYIGFLDKSFVVTKGREDQYETIFLLLTSIDLSRNKLSGDIPREIVALLGLRSLNLSGNKLTGVIPTNIGNMQALESVDLSGNQISGRIPPSMSSMHFLSYLNVSCNNLSGEIPLSTQLQSFNPSSFAGNRLCGPPLTKNCGVHVMLPNAGKKSHKKGEGIKVDGFYPGMMIGFVVAFWGICGPLLYSRSWRISYFSFLNTVWCRLCKMFNINNSQFGVEVEEAISVHS